MSSGIKQWHQIVESGNFDSLQNLLHPETIFRSPMAHVPYKGKQVAALILSTVARVFQDFKYHRSFSDTESNSVTLEFSAKVNGRELKGVDIIRFDDEGRIVEFEVMVRPFSGLQALGEEMQKRLAPYLDQMK
jgi:2,4-dienoyl-CoA reductase (NADPH2)